MNVFIHARPDNEPVLLKRRARRVFDVAAREFRRDPVPDASAAVAEAMAVMRMTRDLSATSRHDVKVAAAFLMNTAVSVLTSLLVKRYGEDYDHVNDLDAEKGKATG
jgi:hypothetical protein